MLEGKPVIAPPREVQEVKNALAVYAQFDDLDPFKETDLLHAHQVLMTGLVDELGTYRHGGVGVMSGNEVVHMAPPATQLSRLMTDLFTWLNGTEQHPLIASAVFHYEFEFIHPFADGNGRMGRLWQSLILAKWNPLFANLPIETLVYAHQFEYYQVIAASTPQVSPQDTPQAVKEILDRFSALSIFCQQPRSRTELQELCKLKDREHFRKTVLVPLLEVGWLQRSLPDKPNSPKQKYFHEVT